MYALHTMLYRGPWQLFFGRCSKGVDPMLDGDPKLVAIDEEADHQIVHGGPACAFEQKGTVLK